MLQAIVLTALSTIVLSTVMAYGIRLLAKQYVDFYKREQTILTAVKVDLLEFEAILSKTLTNEVKLMMGSPPKESFIDFSAPEKVRESEEETETLQNYLKEFKQITSANQTILLERITTLADALKLATNTALANIKTYLYESIIAQNKDLKTYLSGTIHSLNNEQKTFISEKNALYAQSVQDFIKSIFENFGVSKSGTINLTEKATKKKNLTPFFPTEDKEN